MSNLYRGLSIDASYQVSLHLAEGFQRRRLKCEKLMDDRRRTPSDGKSSHCLWQGELKMNDNINMNSTITAFNSQTTGQEDRLCWTKDHYSNVREMTTSGYIKALSITIHCINFCTTCSVVSLHINITIPTSYYYLQRHQILEYLLPSTLIVHHFLLVLPVLCQPVM